MENFYPLNISQQVFFGYYNNDEAPTQEVIDSISNLIPPNGYLEVGQHCFEDWMNVIGDLNRKEDHSLYLGVIISRIDRSYIERAIELYSAHDIEIVFSRKLFYYEREDDFGDERTAIRLEDGEDTSLEVEYILLRINPDATLDLRSRQVISYMLGVIFRMFSILEGHIEEFLNEVGKDCRLKAERALDFICAVNNHYTEDISEREQLICDISVINQDLLLKLNDSSLMRTLFEDHSLTERPRQTAIMMRIRGE